MNPGDVLKVSITDPSSGLTVRVDDLTTGQSGFMQASAANGFANTNLSDCSGNPHTFHAEYSTASQQNQVPWAALEGGVLMEQEVGHFESCNSVANNDPFSVTYGSGTYTDPGTFENCVGGPEGPNARGEGPCPNGVCTGSTTQGFNGPTACPTNDPTTGALCEFSDAPCHTAGSRTATINGQPVTESQPVAGCYQTGEQNGDLDFDGNTYLPDWPDGSANHPTTMRYVGPFMSNGRPYPQVQFETDAPGSENLCDLSTGQDCTAPPISASFYPFWSLNYAQTVAGAPSSAKCVWNFGNDIAELTNNDFAKDGQYGSSDVARYARDDDQRAADQPRDADGLRCADGELAATRVRYRAAGADADRVARELEQRVDRLLLHVGAVRRVGQQLHADQRRVRPDVHGNLR